MNIYTAIEKGLITPEQVAAMPHQAYLQVLLNDESGAGIAALREGLITPEQAAAMPHQAYLQVLLNGESGANGAGITALRIGLITPESVASMRSSQDLSILLSDERIVTITTAINEGLMTPNQAAAIRNMDTIIQWIDAVRNPQNRDFLDFIQENGMDFFEILNSLIEKDKIDHVLSEPELFSTRLTDFINKTFNVNLQNDAYQALRALAEESVSYDHSNHINDEIISLASGPLNPLNRAEFFDYMRARYESDHASMMDPSWAMVDRSTLSGSTAEEKEHSLDEEAVVPFYRLSENEYKLFMANENIAMQKGIINSLLENYAPTEEKAHVFVTRTGMFHHADKDEKPDYPDQDSDNKPSL